MTNTPVHGKYGTYTTYGCRCDDCKQAAREYRKNYRSPALEPGDPRHGKPSAYTNNGCRCDICKRGWADYIAEARRKNNAALKAAESQWDSVACPTCGK